jgi:hypothetical protein
LQFHGPVLSDKCPFEAHFPAKGQEAFYNEGLDTSSLCPQRAFGGALIFIGLH